MPADEAERCADAVLRRGDVGAGTVSSSFEGAEVVGSGISAAWSSFAFFSIGASIPVLPFLVGLESVAAVVAAAVLTGLALIATGGIVGVLSGGPPLRRALRQLSIGTAAAAVTYLLGLGFGAAVG